MGNEKVEQEIRNIFGKNGQKEFLLWEKERAEEPDQIAKDMENLAQYVDHTLLKPEATKVDIVRLCKQAQEYKFASVCVNPVWAKEAKKHLPTVPLCCVVGFPLGACTPEVKLAETKEVLEAGANEVDMVINIGALKDNNLNKVQKEINLLARECHNFGAKLKVIIETCLLSEDEKIIACLLAKKEGADFVKTSTGFSTAGARKQDVALMRMVVGNKMGVKASGGIRDRATALALLKAGANRIGASEGIKICRGENL